jgi:hypothetical protein
VSAALPAIGSAGRAAGSTVHHARALPQPATSDYSSYCLTCASWHFGQNVPRCAKCGDGIFRWVPNEELKHFRSRSSLGGF